MSTNATLNVVERLDAAVLGSLLACATEEDRAKTLRSLSTRVPPVDGKDTIVDLTTRLDPTKGACSTHPIPQSLTNDAGIPKDFGWGRVYPRRGVVTLAGVSRADRSALLKGGEIAWDVDMRSAQSTILLELLDKYTRTSESCYSHFFEAMEQGGHHHEDALR
jgi:hypothetical protein